MSVENGPIQGRLFTIFFWIVASRPAGRANERLTIAAARATAAKLQTYWRSSHTFFRFFLHTSMGQRIDPDFFDAYQRMPEMNGLEATRIIRQLWPDNGPTIIAVTAYALGGDRVKCLEAGMDDYISKPVRIEDLAEQLNKIGTRSNMTSKCETA